MFRDQWPVWRRAGATVTGDAALTGIGTLTADGTVTTPANPASGVFGLIPLPTPHIRRELRTLRYRGHGRTHIRIYVKCRVEPRPVTFAPTSLVVKVAKTAKARPHLNIAKSVRVEKRHRFEKHATPESQAWVAERNREEEAFLIGLLS